MSPFHPLAVPDAGLQSSAAPGPALLCRVIAAGLFMFLCSAVLACGVRRSFAEDKARVRDRERRLQAVGA